MTIEQEAHLQRVKFAFLDAVNAKYRKGAEEHGGTLCDASAESLIEMAMDEAVDQWVYLFTLRENLRKPKCQCACTSASSNG